MITSSPSQVVDSHTVMSEVASDQLLSSTVVDSRVDESDVAFSSIPPDQLFSETTAAVADQQSNVVESPVSVSGEVVVSEAVDQSEVVIPTAAEQSSSDVDSTVPDPPLLTACVPASSVLQIATDDGATKNV